MNREKMSIRIIGGLLVAMFMLSYNSSAQYTDQNHNSKAKQSDSASAFADTLLRNIDAAARSGLQAFDNYYEKAAQYEIEAIGATGRKAATIRRKYLVDAINDVKQQIEDLKDVEGVTQSTIDAYVKYRLKLKKQLRNLK